MGAMALAESANTEAPALPAANELQAEADAQQVDENAQQPEQGAQQDDQSATEGDTALREALDAYRQAKASDRLAALEAELNGYVESGKLTQEQAVMILNRCRELLPV